MLTRIKNVFRRILTMERCPTRLAKSFSIGVFLALSATIPFQTPLIFVFAWLFGGHSGVIFTTVYLINNPFTMIPIYIMDYVFGKWFFHTILNLDLVQYNPAWIDRFVDWLNQYCDVGNCFGDATLCFWCLILGGLLLPLIISLVVYPIVRYLVAKITGNKQCSETAQNETHRAQ